jgi:hypothetical protein
MLATKRSRSRVKCAAADGFPGYVRGWCCMAESGTMQRGYRDVGYLIAVRLHEFRPAQISIRLWQQQVMFLEEHVERNERGAIRAWFKTYYPALIHMIPVRRLGEFAAGLIERLHEENQVQAETYEQSAVR